MAQFRLTLLLLLLSVCYATAQQADDRLAPTRRPLAEVDMLRLPSLNNKELAAAEMARRGPGIAPRFAETIVVDLSPEERGSWETLRDGSEVWRLRISSPDAHSLNLGFSKFVMPEGGTLILYAPDRQTVMGPFTPADNEEHEELWTPILPGDELVVEVRVPAGQRSHLGLRLKTVNHDFLGFSTVMSGSCNLDVICSAADGWGIVDLYRDIIQSVAVIGLGGGTFCTGFLVNNTRQDCKPFFITANHCGINNGNAASLVVYWNYVNSFCRQPNTGISGAPGDGDLSDFNTGSIFRASYAPSDMTLVELDDPVSPTANAFFAGWNATNALEQDTVIGIHHPSTDEKRISFEFDGVYVGAWGQGSTPVPNGNHLVIADWDIGTTEGGSSGSPIFNSKKQVIGQLHGGLASCSNNSYDSYGWFFTSWTGGGTPATRLSNWLDPDNTGALELNGRAQQLCSFFVNATPQTRAVCAPASAVYQLEVGQTFAGPVALTLQGLPAGATAAFSATTANPGAMVTLTISNTGAAAAGTYALTVSATDGANSATTPISLRIVSGAPAALALSAPANGAADLPLVVQLGWAAGGDTYEWQLAADANFTTIIQQGAGLTATSVATPALETATTYYWRVRAANLCGLGAWSEVFSFSTGDLACLALQPADLPVIISEDTGITVSSVLDVAVPGLISSIRVTDVQISHSWVGDLSARLISPAGTSVELFNRPGTSGNGFGCNGSDIDVSFDDLAVNTAQNFETTCNDAPAIEGNFQPMSPLSAFIGEAAAGQWRLEVTDHASSDGGFIANWNLEFCATIPSEVNISATPSSLSVCAGATATASLNIGGGFAGPVTLTATGLPMGVSATFSPNPAAPGSSATVTLSGLSGAGLFELNIEGADGANSTSAAIEVSVQGPPATPALAAPANGALNQPIPLNLQWSAVSGATGYQLVVSAQPDLSNPVVNQALGAGATQSQVSALLTDTQYYWAVSATGACGSSALNNVRSFTTAPNLSLVLSTPAAPTCGTGVASYVFAIGPDFEAPLTVTYTAQPAASLTLSTSSTSTQLFVNAGDLFSNAAGVYQLTFVVTDAGGRQNSVSAPLTILSAPGLAALQSPANGSALANAAVQFNWSAAPNAASYRIDIATDPQFANIVQTATTAALTYSYALSEGGLYYWRVTATNTCGDAVAAPFNFTYTPVSVYELRGVRIDLLPNPTPGPVSLVVNGALSEPIQVAWFAANGQYLGHEWIGAGFTGSYELNLSHLPAGAYLLRLSSGQATATQRIVKQ